MGFKLNDVWLFVAAACIAASAGLLIARVLDEIDRVALLRFLAVATVSLTASLVYIAVSAVAGGGDSIVAEVSSAGAESPDSGQLAQVAPSRTPTPRPPPTATRSPPNTATPKPPPTATTAPNTPTPKPPPTATTAPNTPTPKPAATATTAPNTPTPRPPTATTAPNTPTPPPTATTAANTPTPPPTATTAPNTPTPPPTATVSTSVEANNTAFLAKPVAYLSGAIFDSAGRPIPKAYVRVTSSPYLAEGSQETFSSDAGGYQLELRQASYNVYVSATGYEPSFLLAREQLPEIQGDFVAPKVTLKRREEVTVRPRTEASTCVVSRAFSRDQIPEILISQGIISAGGDIQRISDGSMSGSSWTAFIRDDQTVSVREVSYAKKEPAWRVTFREGAAIGVNELYVEKRCGNVGAAKGKTIPQTIKTPVR